MIYLFLLVLILNILDVYTTQRIIKSGGREIHPVVKKAIEYMGLITGLVVLKCGALAVLGVVTLIVGAHWLMYVLYVVIVLIYGFVVVHNFKQLK